MSDKEREAMAESTKSGTLAGGSMADAPNTPIGAADEESPWQWSKWGSTYHHIFPKQTVFEILDLSESSRFGFFRPYSQIQVLPGCNKFLPLSGGGDSRTGETYEELAKYLLLTADRFNTVLCDKQDIYAAKSSCSGSTTIIRNDGILSFEALRCHLRNRVLTLTSWTCGTKQRMATLL